MDLQRLPLSTPLLLLFEFTERLRKWSRKLTLIRSDSETQFLDHPSGVHLGGDAQGVLDGGRVGGPVGDHADAVEAEEHRTALTLRYLEGLDYRAIETTMGLSNGALRGILGRALGTLRRMPGFESMERQSL